MLIYIFVYIYNFFYIFFFHVEYIFFINIFVFFVAESKIIYLNILNINKNYIKGKY